MKQIAFEVGHDEKFRILDPGTNLDFFVHHHEHGNEEFYTECKHQCTICGREDKIEKLRRKEAISVMKELDWKDIKIDTWRGGGLSSGHTQLQPTTAAVMLTHLPTGISVSCGDYNSLHKNKLVAYEVLNMKIGER